MQRLFPLTISLSVAILLSSCAPAAPAPGAPTAPPPAATTGNLVTITFGGNAISRAKYEPLINRFNTDNPDVQVQFVALDAQIAQARAAAAPGKPYDSFLLAQRADTTDTLDTIAIGRLVSEGTIGMWNANLVSLPATVPFAVGAIPLNVPALFLFASTNYAMSRGTQHPDAAWRWVSFLSQQYLPHPLEGATEQIPPRASVAAAADFWAPLPPDEAAAVQTVLNCPARAFTSLQVEYVSL